MDTPDLKIVSDAGRYVIRDDAGTTYGAYDSRKDAEAAIADWLAYYAAPLVF